MLKDRVALITGGTGGLGRAVTLHFLREGARCAVPYRSPVERDELSQEAAPYGDRLFCFRADLLRAEELDALVAAVLERFGGIEILLNLAGAFTGGTTVAETDPAAFDRMLDLNLRSVFLVSRAVIPHLVRRGGGKILSVAARAALQGSAGLGAYAASKAGVITLTQSMADELRDANVQVNCILPSIIDTPANRRAMPNADPSRWVDPAEIARVLAFLASDESRVISGAAVPVYGRA
jgi:NAD(P)-dependent dehydrogenase (short-subunit alcohol dehydrogenase family)